MMPPAAQILFQRSPYLKIEGKEQKTKSSGTSESYDPIILQ
jgi:hypothetical protein